MQSQNHEQTPRNGYVDLMLAGMFEEIIAYKSENWRSDDAITIVIAWSYYTPQGTTKKQTTKERLETDGINIARQFEEMNCEEMHVLRLGFELKLCLVSDKR